jgi:hypothetical protein
MVEGRGKSISQIFFSKGTLKWIIAAIVLLIAGFIFKKWIVLAVLAVVLITIDYFIHVYRSPINPTPLFFISVLATIAYGPLISVPFTLIVGFLPNVAAGRFEIGESMEIIAMVMLSVISAAFYSSGNIISTGIMISVAFFVATLGVVFVSEGGEAKITSSFEAFIVLIINLVLFSRLGEMFLSVMV